MQINLEETLQPARLDAVKKYRRQKTLIKKMQELA
mgnify:CR=1 FL=1